ncbi:MAG TPA: hypothetical protein VFA18_25010 [Gemmataceae bacterium]|nr:hypothetical protein [Gemmataceae bacterium]
MMIHHRLAIVLALATAWSPWSTADLPAQQERLSTAKFKARVPPPAMDLCKYQTPICNQGGRDTCPYFPPVAALEAAYRRKGVKVKLSEEHLIWLRNVTAQADRNDRGTAENMSWTVGGGNGMGILKQYGICRAQDMPYHTGVPDQTMKQFGLPNYDWGKPVSQFLLNRWNFDASIYPWQARLHARYAIDSYVTMPPPDLRSPRRFEQVLASGHEIIFALSLHDNSDDSALGQPVWRLKPGTRAGTVNHFMLMVGYDRRRHFFIVKNQWGPTNYDPNKLAVGWKDVVRFNGYTLVDYNYLDACTEAHYITKVASPGAARLTLQRALGQWRVTFKRRDKALMSGVLVWRHTAQPGAKRPDLRIGDLVTQDRKQFRVNARIKRDGNTGYQVTLYINFKTGALPEYSTSGVAWKGTLSLPQNATGSFSLTGAGASDQRLWGARASEVRLVGTQAKDKNLLSGLRVP